MRCTGCNLRCSYCDTRYAYEEGFDISEEQLLKRIGAFGITSVTITGGEPLLQSEVFPVIDTLIRRNYTVLVETNGTIDVAGINKKAIKVLDIKCPGSGESEKTNWENLKKLTDHDELKFVIASREDYDWAKWIMHEFSLSGQFTTNFSPVHGILKPEQLASWILQDDIPVRLNLQLHRYLWKNRKRGV